MIVDKQELIQDALTLSPCPTTHAADLPLLKRAIEHAETRSIPNALPLGLLLNRRGLSFPIGTLSTSYLKTFYGQLDSTLCEDFSLTAGEFLANVAQEGR
jgi:hypothetical protein